MRSRKLRITAAVAALAWLASLTLVGASAQADTIDGVEFVEQVQIGEGGGGDLELRGLATLRWRRLIKAYAAALYLDDGTPSHRVFDDVPKRLEIEYFWSIEGDDFGPAAEQILARGMSEADLTALRPRLARMHAAFRSVRPGDRYALTYVPGRGTELSLNGERLVSVPGADFAAAYFAIWLGEQPIDGGFRDRLLGGS